MEIAKYYTDAFFADCDKLNIKRPDVVEPATNCIPKYIHMIETLLDKGLCLSCRGNVYFDTSKLKQYYVFNDHDEEDLAVGVREAAWKRTKTRRTRTTLSSGSPSPSLRIRLSSGILPGAWAIPAGTLSAPAFP